MVVRQEQFAQTVAKQRSIGMSTHEANTIFLLFVFDYVTNILLSLNTYKLVATRINL